MSLRRALPPILAWCLFLRLTLLATLVFVTFPFLATGALRPRHGQRYHGQPTEQTLRR